MGASISKGSDTVVVPEDATKVLIDAIEKHSEATPAFDIIRSSFKGKPYSIDSLLSNKNPPVLTLACKKTHDDLVVFLLDEMKANPNPKLALSFGVPALTEMMFKYKAQQSLAGAKALVRAGADPNAVGFAGATPYTKVLDTFKTAPMAREMLMVLATKDGLITDLSAIPVPTSALQNQNLRSPNKNSAVFIHEANPLHYAVASENSIGALVMLELGVDPTAKTGGPDPKSLHEIMKEFTTFDQALYDTIQIIIDDRTQAKKATEIYDGLVTKTAAESNV